MSVEPFLDVCNAYGAEKHMDVSFFQDEEEGWFARFSLGLHSALVKACEPRGPEKEFENRFQDRVYELIDKSIANAKHKQAKRERLAA